MLSFLAVLRPKSHWLFKIWFKTHLPPEALCPPVSPAETGNDPKPRDYCLMPRAPFINF